MNFISRTLAIKTVAQYLYGRAWPRHIVRVADQHWLRRCGRTTRGGGMETESAYRTNAYGEQCGWVEPWSSAEDVFKTT